MRILITGGAGFTGSTLISHLLTETGPQLLNIDKPGSGVTSGWFASVGETNHNYCRFYQTVIHYCNRLAGMVEDLKLGVIAPSASEVCVRRYNEGCQSSVYGDVLHIRDWRCFVQNTSHHIERLRTMA